MSKKITLYSETTDLSVIRTCAEVEQELLKHGVSQMWKRYNEKGDIEGIAFVLREDDNDIAIKLPFNWRAIQQLAEEGLTKYTKTKQEDQARRVAARQMFRWVQAQLAFRQTKMVTIMQVFLPYVVVDSEKETTLYEKVKDIGGVNRLMLTGEHNL